MFSQEILHTVVKVRFLLLAKSFWKSIQVLKGMNRWGFDTLATGPELLQEFVKCRFAGAPPLKP